MMNTGNSIYFYIFSFSLGLALTWMNTRHGCNSQPHMSFDMKTCYHRMVFSCCKCVVVFTFLQYSLSEVTDEKHNLKSMEFGAHSKYLKGKKELCVLCGIVYPESNKHSWHFMDILSQIYIGFVSRPFCKTTFLKEKSTNSIAICKTKH